MSMNNHNETATPAQDENSIISERRSKLAALREQGVAFPNDFRPEHKAADLHAQYGEQTNEELEAQPIKVSRILSFTTSTKPSPRKLNKIKTNGVTLKTIAR